MRETAPLPNPELSSQLPLWIMDLSAILGIFGFIITIVVMIQLFSIKKSFKSRARLPEIINELQKSGSSLNKGLPGWPEKKNQSRVHVKTAASLLRTTLPLIKNDTKTEISAIELRISTAASSFSTPHYDDPDNVWEVYADIQTSITRLDQFVKNLRWE